MTLDIFPASPAPDITFAPRQQKPRISDEAEYGYIVSRHRSNIAKRTFQSSYTNIPYSEKNTLKDFLVGHDYGLDPFLFKHPTDNITEYAAANQDGVLELKDETVGSIAQGFQFPFQNAIHRVQLYLNKIGSPGGQLTARINTDSSGVPSGSVLATSDNVAVSTITGTLTLVEFTFATPVRLEAFTQYHVLLGGDAAYDSSFATGVTAVQLGVDASSPSYSYGSISTYASSTWTADAAKDGIFLVPDYTKVQTDESLWNEQRVANANNGIFNVSLTLIEDLS